VPDRTAPVQFVPRRDVALTVGESSDPA